MSELARSVWMRPGLVGLHLLRHETPPLAATTEQKIRGNGDRVADWVLTGGIIVDAIHLDRSGGSAADLVSLPPAQWAFFQICQSA